MTLYDVSASMQIDAAKIEAMPLTITVTMSVAAWRKVREGLMRTNEHHTATINMRCAIDAAMDHIDNATRTKLPALGKPSQET